MESTDEEINRQYIDSLPGGDKKPWSKYSSLIFLILITIFIVVMIFTIIILVKNIDLIKQDPLVYGMERMDYDSCDCIDSYGKVWNVNKSSYLLISDQFRDLT